MKHEEKLKQIIKLVYSEIDRLDKLSKSEESEGISLSDTHKLIKFFKLLNEDEDNKIDLTKLTDEQLESLLEEK